MKYDFLVLGGSGMQGRIVIRDLMENGYSVFAASLHKEGINKLLKKFGGLKFDYIDLRNLKQVRKLIKKVGADVIVNCAEGDWDLNVYKICLDLKKHVIDLGSDIPMTKKQIAMGEEFKRKNLTAITGCGSTPGINNIMLCYARNFFDQLDTVEAGFVWDSNIKQFVVPFSMPSIIEEFTDPAPIIENGKWYKKTPLDTIIERKFRKIGNQKIFLVRHPETYTFYYYFKKNGLKNVRFYAGFPDHSMEAIRTFIDIGLASQKELVVDDKITTPVNLLNQALKGLGYPKGYTEQENLWVDIQGKKDNVTKKILMECVVDTLPGWEDAGCNIDTGMPASIIAQMIKNGVINTRGSFDPGPVVPHREFFKELRKRKMVVYQNGKIIN